MPASHGRGRRDPHPHSGSGGPGSPPARGEGAARAPPTRPRGDSAGAGSLRGRPASGGGTVGAESARSSCCALPPGRAARRPAPSRACHAPSAPARVRKRAPAPPTGAGHAPHGPPEARAPQSGARTPQPPHGLPRTRAPLHLPPSGLTWRARARAVPVTGILEGGGGCEHSGAGAQPILPRCLPPPPSQGAPGRGGEEPVAQLPGRPESGTKKKKTKKNLPLVLGELTG